MKKGIILAIVAVAAIAAPAFAVAFHHHGQCVNNTRCLACGGTGFGYGPGGRGTGNFPCTSCHGTGFYGSY